MQEFEYSAIPAPMRSDKVKGAKTPTDRYAVTLTDAINQMAADGWEYLRAETLPSEERSGLTGRTTVFHNVLIFRRPLAAARPGMVPAADKKPAAVAAQAANPATTPVTPPGPVTPPAADPETRLPPASAATEAKLSEKPATDKPGADKAAAEKPAVKKDADATSSPIFSGTMRPATEPQAQDAAQKNRVGPAS